MTHLLDKRTATPEQIAAKHGVSLGMIRRELKRGVAVEHEHTSDAATAEEIALDHLGERPDYYTKLSKMEKEPVQKTDLRASKEKKMSESRLHQILNTLNEALGYAVTDHIPEANIRAMENWSDKVSAAPQASLSWVVDIINKELAKSGAMLADSITEADLKKNSCDKDVDILFYGTEDKVANLKCHIKCDPLNAEQRDPNRKEGSLLKVSADVKFVRVDTKESTYPERPTHENTAGQPAQAIVQPNQDVKNDDE